MVLLLKIAYSYLSACPKLPAFAKIGNFSPLLDF